MNLKIFASELKGNITVPPSKSHSIRAIILASFTIGKSTIQNVLNSQDIISCIACMQKLGVTFIKTNCTQTNFTLEIIPPKYGLTVKISNSKETIIKLNAGNSGSVLYFLAIILCFIPNKTFIITGDTSLSARPVMPILDIFNQLNVKYEVDNIERPTLPLKFTGSINYDTNNSNVKLNLDGKFSQVISGVLISAGIFGFDLSLSLIQVGEKPYLKMTCNWLESLGIKFYTFNLEEGFFEIQGNNKVTCFKKTITGDWSSASFIIIAAIITNSQIVIENLNLNDSQGDSKIIQILNQMGANIKIDSKYLTVYKSAQLKGLIIDCAEIPDLVPILALIACFAKGKTELINAEICRFKECDRLSATCKELLKLGADITEKKDGIIINGGKKLNAAYVESHKDHRIAMMLAIAGLSINSVEPVIVHDCECFNISFPNFISKMKKLGANFIQEFQNEI